MLVCCKRSVYLRLVYSDLFICMFVVIHMISVLMLLLSIGNTLKICTFINVSCHHQFPLFLTGFKYVVLKNNKSTSNRRAKASKPDAMHVPPNLPQCGSVHRSFAVLIKFYHSLNVGSTHD
jgi:hypothetical protein